MNVVGGPFDIRSPPLHFPLSFFHNQVPPQSLSLVFFFLVVVLWCVWEPLENRFSMRDTQGFLKKGNGQR